MIAEGSGGLRRSDVDLQFGTLLVLGSTTFFYSVKLLVKTIKRPKSLSEEEWSWRNLYVSWIHACMSAVWVLACALMYPEMFEDLVYHINYATYFCTCFGTGYFVYDSLDIAINKKLNLRREIVIHHVVCITLFYYTLYTEALIVLSILALSVEVNSVFLHWRRLLLIVKTPPESPKFILIKYLNLITFVVFRGVPVYIITSSCFTLPLLGLLPYEVILLGRAGMCIIAIMNVVLFWRCLKNDFLRGSKIFNLKKA